MRPRRPAQLAALPRLNRLSLQPGPAQIPPCCRPCSSSSAQTGELGSYEHVRCQGPLTALKSCTALASDTCRLISLVLFNCWGTPSWTG